MTKDKLPHAAHLRMVYISRLFFQEFEDYTDGFYAEIDPEYTPTYFRVCINSDVQPFISPAMMCDIFFFLRGLDVHPSLKGQIMFDDFSLHNDDDGDLKVLTLGFDIL